MRSSCASATSQNQLASTSVLERFTPRRVGTFIYHTHWHNPGQLSGRIYGPLVVLEPRQSWERGTDHIIMIGLEGRYRNLPDEPWAINGESKPRPFEHKAGVAHRLRIVNITGDGVSVTLQLLSVHDPIPWTPLGKDGRELPRANRTAQPSRQQVAVGETYDFELAPMPTRTEGMAGATAWDGRTRPAMAGSGAMGGWWQV